MDNDDFVHTLELMLLSKQSYAGLSVVERDRQRLADVIARTAVFMGEQEAFAAKDKLMGYYSALADLGRGITHPIFIASTRIGKPPPSSEVWRSRATVAIALDCFLRANVSFEDAIKQIKKVPNIQRLVSTGRTLEKSVKNWRDTLNDGTVQNDIALERWRDAQRAMAKAVAPDEISRDMLFSKEAERLLEVAADEIALIVLPREAE